MSNGYRGAKGQEGSFAHRLGAWLARRARLVIVLVLALTAALAVPMVAMQPTETASQYPGGEVIDAQLRAGDLFAGPFHRVLFVAEARSGNILTRGPLLDLLRGGQDLAAHPRLSRVLADTYHPATGTRATGLFTIADAVDRTLRSQGVSDGLAGSDDAQVAGAVTALLGSSTPTALGLAVQTAQSEDGRWSSPAAVFAVDADNAALGGGGMLVTIGTDDTTKEQFARDLLEVFRRRGTQLQLWTVAADLNLTSNEQGTAAGPFIATTIVAVLAILGISFRSYWAAAISGAALGMLMVWLKGGSNLLGLENDQLLATVVPISMIAFGIDSAFHAIGRYREQSANGGRPAVAYVAAIGGVLAALALAVTSDTVAFLSNVTSSIESVVQFGLAAALAALSAFALLGLVTPLVLSQIEDRIGAGGMSRRGPKADIVLVLLAAVGAAIPVMAIVFISPALGIVLLGFYIWLAILWPFQAQRFTPPTAGAARPAHLRSDRLARLIRAASARSGVTLTVAGVLTLGMLWSASNLETRFDVRDFFSEDADFVVGLDKVDRYMGDRGGEPATILIEADLSQPRVLAVIDQTAEKLAALESERLAKTDDGETVVHRGVLDVFDRVMWAPIGLAAVETVTGVRPADQNRDGLPDTEQQAAAILTAASEQGLPSIDGNPPMGPEEVGALVAKLGDGEYATTLGLEIPNTKVQSNIVEARAALEPIADRLEAELRNVDRNATTVLTGSAVFRDEQLSAIFRSLLVALPVAVIACMAVAIVFMRSLRFALVSVVPILLVVIWLYGLMQLAGYAINVVTAIIGAISVGVGIDFATHFSMRYLEESRRHARRLEAMEAAGAGTGTALLGSAGTSVVGFAILAFAPMPMFATYGLLTAVMIALALAASLIVLPALLIRLRPPGLIQLEIPGDDEAWASAVLGSMAASADDAEKTPAQAPVAAASLDQRLESVLEASPNGDGNHERGRSGPFEDDRERPTVVAAPAGGVPARSEGPAAEDGQGQRTSAGPGRHEAPVHEGAPTGPSTTTVPAPRPRIVATAPNRPDVQSSRIQGPMHPPATKPSTVISDRRPVSEMTTSSQDSVPAGWLAPVEFAAKDPTATTQPVAAAGPPPQGRGRREGLTSSDAPPNPPLNTPAEPFLRVGLATDLPPTIARLAINGITASSNPKSIRLLDGAGEDLVREIRGGILDIAIVSQWPGQETVPPGVKAGELASTVLALAVRNGTRIGGTADLERATWVSGAPWSPQDDAISIACTRVGFRPFITHRVSSPRLALDIVRGTGAITLLPRASAREAGAQGITLHPLPDLGKYRVLVIIPREPADPRIEQTALFIRKATTQLRNASQARRPPAKTD